MTTEPTKEMIALARECAAREAERQYPHIPEMAAKFRAGENDDYGLAVGAALAAIQATNSETVYMWRNGVSNTAAIVDIVRRRHERAVRRSKAFAAFDADLDAELQSWFDATHSAHPHSYDEAESLWKSHLKETPDV